MEIKKTGDTEKETPANNAENQQEKKPVTVEELEAQLAAERTKREEKETQAAQLTEQLRLAREAKRDPLIVAPKVEKPKEDDQGYVDPNDFETLYAKKREQERKDDYINRVNDVYNKFIQDKDVEMDAQTDLEFRQVCNDSFLGNTESEVQKRMLVIYNGIKGVSVKKDDTSKTLNIGDGGSDDTKRNEQKNSWLTKKLDKYQLAAANALEGGEKAYREKMQEIEDARIS